MGENFSIFEDGNRGRGRFGGGPSGRVCRGTHVTVPTKILGSIAKYWSTNGPANYKPASRLAQLIGSKLNVLNLTSGHTVHETPLVVITAVAVPAGAGVVDPVASAVVITRKTDCRPRAFLHNAW